MALAYNFGLCVSKGINKRKGDVAKILGKSQELKVCFPCFDK